MVRLRRSDCSRPGIRRRRRGKGFSYHHPDGERVTDPATLQRISDLVIPPAWEDVWISPHPNGHLQAVGTDAAGRRQYRYHDAWRQRRDAEKFDRMVEFARTLPRLREVCAEHLQRDELDKPKVLACAARLLDQGFFRIGGESYETYGLATMRREHVTITADAVVFEYESKGGKERLQYIVDPEVREVVTALKRRRGGGDELLAYQQGGRGSVWRDLTSRDINEFLKSVCGKDVSAKDFRTWNATVLAAVALAVSGEAATSKTAAKRAETRAVKEVAGYLGNTPAVARKSYIDPCVFDRYRSGWTIAGVLEELGETQTGGPSMQGAVEEAVIDLLERRTSSGAIEKGRRVA